MENSFVPTARAEAQRWLTISEKLLSARDLMGSKSFATRARDADPTLTSTDQILAIVDTLISGEIRIGNNQHDWYAILRLTQQQGQDLDLIASKYRSIALILNPQNNKFILAEQALHLVVEAWSVLSSPSKKSIYDKEFSLYFHSQQQQNYPDPFQNQIPTMRQKFVFFAESGGTGVDQQQIHASGSNNVGVNNFHFDSTAVGSTCGQPNFMGFASGSNLVFGSGYKSSPEHGYKNYTGCSGNTTFASGSSHEQDNNKQKLPMRNHPSVSHKTKNNVNAGENEDNDDEAEPVDVQEQSFWTACPYCYNMFEYPMMYLDCTMRCQNCRKAFQAVKILTPPPVEDGEKKYFCCWGFLPLGFSMEDWEKNKATSATWSPFSPMFACPADRQENLGKNSAPRVYVEDDEVFVEISDSSGPDDDTQINKGVKKKARNVEGKGANGMSSGSMNTKIDKQSNVNLEGFQTG